MNSHFGTGAARRVKNLPVNSIEFATLEIGIENKDATSGSRLSVSRHFRTQVLCLDDIIRNELRMNKLQAEAPECTTKGPDHTTKSFIRRNLPVSPAI